MGIITEDPLLRIDHFNQYKELFVKNENSLWDIPENPFDSYGEFKNVNPLEEGFKVVSDIRATLNLFSRHPLQCQMHESMIKCSAKIIFGCDTVQKYDTVIRKKYGWNNLKQEQMITAPRRFGKTRAVAMFISAFAMCKRGVEIAIFSTGGRASGVDTGMMKAIIEILTVILKVPKENIHHNKEHLTINMGEGDIRRIHAYPASNDAYVYLCVLLCTTTKLVSLLCNSLLLLFPVFVTGFFQKL
jgi:hypothetical protein